MLFRLILIAGLLLVTGCTVDDGPYYEPASPTTYYSPTDYGAPYQPGSPVYTDPYANGPVMGGIYVYGDAGDSYGGPVFTPYRGIRCDRRRQTCWNQQGPDPRWTGRFFGRPQQHWGNGNGGNWNQGHWNGGQGNGGHWNGGQANGGNWNQGNGQHGTGVPWGNNNATWPRQTNNNQGNGWQNHGGNNPGGNNKPNNNNRPWVYQVPKNPNGQGQPTFLPNGCGNGQQPCN